MSSGRTAAAAGERGGSGAGRVIRAWRVLPQERRLAAGSAIGLFVTLFLPWYQETVIPTGTSRPGALPSASLTGWAAFSPVEAAVLLVAAGVLTLLFIRAEGRAFHVPGGDGGVITAAGFWTCVLIIWRIFDKQGTNNHNQFVTTSGIEWGIFIALLVAAVMAYAGNRIRAAHQPEPPLPGEESLLKDEPHTGGRPPRGAWTPRPVAADAPRQSRADAPAQPTRRLGTDEERTRPLRTGSAGPSERTQAPRSGPDNTRGRTLPLDPGPADTDWEVGEFRTRRLTDEDRGPRRPEPPDDQQTIPLEHDDG